MKRTAREFPPESERHFQDRKVLPLLHLHRWLCYHTHDSRMSPLGFPDITAVRGKVLLFAELKRDGEKMTPEQEIWLRSLDRVEIVQTHLWTPSMWDDVVEIVEGR